MGHLSFGADMKFRYLDKVRIIRGFYEGYTGVLEKGDHKEVRVTWSGGLAGRPTTQAEHFSQEQVIYGVRLDRDSARVDINERDLELVDRPSVARTT